jgi:hypothetical protein
MVYEGDHSDGSIRAIWRCRKPLAACSRSRRAPGTVMTWPSRHLASLLAVVECTRSVSSEERAIRVAEFPIPTQKMGPSQLPHFLPTFDLPKLHAQALSRKSGTCFCGGDAARRVHECKARRFGFQGGDRFQSRPVFAQFRSFWPAPTKPSLHQIHQ